MYVFLWKLLIKQLRLPYSIIYIGCRPTKYIVRHKLMVNLNLLTDQALGEGTSESFDGLGFETYASVLADAARGNPGPFTIGVFGEWGTGKTSLTETKGSVPMPVS